MLSARRTLSLILVFAFILTLQLFMALPAHAAEIDDLLALVNAARAANGAGPLSLCNELSVAAQNHSNDMATRVFFDHVNPDGADPGVRISAAGYNWSTYGENIAWGQNTAQEVFDAWMNSSGHRANILNGNFVHMGLGTSVGLFPGSGFTGKYWTQVFGAGGSCSGVGIPAPVGGSPSGGGSANIGTSFGAGGGSVYVSNSSCLNNSNVLIGLAGFECQVVSGAQIGVQSVVDQGFIYAVDLFGAVPSFGVGVCLRGRGSIIFLGAEGMPRVPESYASLQTGDGFTCTTVARAGTVVLVARGGSVTTTAVITNPTTTTTTTNTVTTSSTPATTGTRTYVIQYGDTLFRIARRFGTTVAVLSAANGIVNPDLIYAGTTIVIPA